MESPWGGPHGVPDGDQESITTPKKLMDCMNLRIERERCCYKFMLLILTGQARPGPCMGPGPCIIRMLSAQAAIAVAIAVGPSS